MRSAGFVAEVIDASIGIPSDGLALRKALRKLVGTQ